MKLPKFDTLRVQVEKDTLVVTLDRPGYANAVNRQMLTDLIAVTDWLDGKSQINFMILTGEGAVFAAGQDLKELHAELASETESRSAARSLQRLARDAMTKLEAIEQISFAVIQGSAYGAGVALAMTTDFRLISDKAVIGLPETKLGLFLTYGAMPRLVRAVGASKAKDLVMFARNISATEAFELGLAECVLPESQLQNEVWSRIEQLREMDMRALRLTKRIAQAASAINFGDILVTEPELVEGALSESDVVPRLEGFLNRSRSDSLRE